MKKKGFTLAEILVTIGVIGIVAAVSMPLVSKFKPDDNKIKFLQTYDSIVEATVALANNRVLYPTMAGQNAGNIIYDKAPFGNTAQPKDAGLKSGAYSGIPKFCRLLAYSFGVDATTTCQKTYVDYYDKFAPNFTPDFTTQNGVDFMILTKGPTIAGNTLFYRSDIYIDINGSEEGKNCSYSSTCKIPDRFKLAVESDGNVVALDPMARKYLQTRSNWKYREGMKGSKWNNFVDESKPIERVLARVNEYAPVIKYETPKFDGGGGGGGDDDDDDKLDFDEQPSPPEKTKIIVSHNIMRDGTVNYDGTTNYMGTVFYRMEDPTEPVPNLGLVWITLDFGGYQTSISSNISSYGQTTHLIKIPNSITQSGVGIVEIKPSELYLFENYKLVF